MDWICNYMLVVLLMWLRALINVSKNSPDEEKKKKKREAKVPQNLLPYILSIFSQFKQTFLSCHKPPWVPPFSCVIDRFRC